METETEESTAKKAENKVSNRQSAKMRILKDILFLLFLGFPMILYKFLQLVINKHHHGGFFCDDPTLQYPFKESTVSETTVVLQTLLVPIFTIIIVEYYHNNNTKQCKNDADDDKIKVNVTYLVYRRIAHYIFGYIACCSFMWLPKYFDGNLRPHFMDVCRPILPDGSDCGDTKNHGKFIRDYVCGNPDFFISIYRSFPSGHSSQAFFGATYLVMYFQAKVKRERFRIGMQFLLLLYAYAVSISRIYDWHHHGRDVVVGCSLGVFCAMVTCMVVENSFRSKRKELN